MLCERVSGLQRAEVSLPHMSQPWSLESHEDMQPRLNSEASGSIPTLCPYTLPIPQAHSPSPSLHPISTPLPKPHPWEATDTGLEA